MVLNLKGEKTRRHAQGVKVDRRTPICAAPPSQPGPRYQSLRIPTHTGEINLLERRFPEDNFALEPRVAGGEVAAQTSWKIVAQHCPKSRLCREATV